MKVYYTHYPSPIGKLRLRATDAGLVSVDHTNQQEKNSPDWIQSANHPVLQQATNELDAYFARKRTTFDTPLTPEGTDFQKQVWSALQTIPFGQTASYSDIANKLNNPKAVRAIGAANGRNPLSIFIPCHRIIGKNGTLTGYAGGMENKQILLELEGQQRNLGL
jgi:methylated-DNA-[protein]-cysteine S-methyltransferase